MAKRYAPKTFIRQVRGTLLNQCLRRHGIDEDLDIDIIKPAVVETIFQKLMALPAEQLSRIEQDFATITELASREGVDALLKQAAEVGVDAATPFSHARNDYERACWAFLNHPDVFELATCFHAMDRIGAGRWRQRWVGENLPPATDAQAIARLQCLMRNCYAQEGRGRRCHIDYYLRQDPVRHCFFAYPEDHLRTELGYDRSGNLRERPRKSAFEVIFVYRPDEGVLEVMAPGGKDRAEDLVGCFCYAILDLPDVPLQPLSWAYDLSQLKQPHIRFPLSPEDGIERIQLRELKLRLPIFHGWRRHLHLIARPHAFDPESLYRTIIQTLQLEHVALDDVTVASARFCFIFSPVDGSKPRRRVFTVSLPDLCDLRDSHHDNIIRKYLRRQGFIIDPALAEAAA